MRTLDEMIIDLERSVKDAVDSNTYVDSTVANAEAMLRGARYVAPLLSELKTLRKARAIMHFANGKETPLAMTRNEAMRYFEGIPLITPDMQEWQKLSKSYAKEFHSTEVE